MTGAVNILEMSKLQMPIKQHCFPEMTHLAYDEMLKETKTYETVQTNLTMIQKTKTNPSHLSQHFSTAHSS